MSLSLRSYVMNLENLAGPNRFNEEEQRRVAEQKRKEQAGPRRERMQFCRLNGKLDIIKAHTPLETCLKGCTPCLADVDRTLAVDAIPEAATEAINV